MAESILQSYLNAQHIKTSEQGSIESLKKAVTEVKKILEKKRPLIISYTLVALDPNVNSTEPVVQDVEKVIIKKWPAFKNSVTATKDKSTTYVRAVILESLSQMAKKENMIAAIIWHTARDTVSYYSIGGEVDIIKSVLQSLANQMEEAGQEIWGIASKVEIGTFEGNEINIEISPSAMVSGENIEQHFKAGSLHTSWGDGGESSYTTNQGNANWPTFFSERVASGLTEEINSALAKQNKSLSSVSKSIKENLDDYFSALRPFFEKISSTYASNIIANNKRSELLWWKQTLCSPRLRQSYRGFSLLETAILMAIDLADQVDPIYPISVDYLLRETLKDVHGEEVDNNRSLSEWIDISLKLNELFKELLIPFSNDKEGRKSLLEEMSNAISKGEAKSFFKVTGIDQKASISLSSLAVWLFHEIQASKIVSSK